MALRVSPLMWASRFLNEAAMGFLALVAVATAMGTLVFDVAPETDRLLTVVEWVVVSLFITEFAVQFAAAPDRSAWLRSPWRVVDAICIGAPLLSLLPQVSDAARGALVLRFLRVGRAVAFGARASVLTVQRQRGVASTLTNGDTRVTLVAADGTRLSTWDELVAATRESRAGWYHASGIDAPKLQELTHAARVPEQDRAHLLDREAQPRIRGGPQSTSLVLSLPEAAETGFPRVTRTRVLVFVFGKSVVTASMHPIDLAGLVAAEPTDDGLETVNLPARTVFRLFELVRSRSEAVVRRQEEEVFRLDDMRANEGGTAFLNGAFLLQREISTTTSDLWRFREIVRSLTDGKVTLPEIDITRHPSIQNLLNELDGLFDQFGQLKESLTALMELHMNVTSFEMNKFMKLLAIVGFLGLIPSVAGGLLGMNVYGNPWPVTLEQVAFAIGMGMAVSLYIFAIKGWLR